MLGSIRSRSFLLLAFAALCSTQTARAGFVTQTVYTGPTPTSLTTTDFNIPLTFMKFDKSLGTLTDIQISYSDSSNISGTLTNYSTSAQSFMVTQSTLYNLNLSTTNILNNTLSASQTYTNLASNASADFGGYQASGVVGPTTLTSGVVFNAFNTASGNIILNFATLTTTTVTGGGGNVTTGIYTTAGAGVTVQYDYTPSNNPNTAVPEPMSLVMMSMGALGILGASRITRRVRRKS